MAPHEAVEIQPIELPVNFDLLAVHASFPARYPFLLESVAIPRARPGALGAYDILFAFPGQTLRLDHNFRLHGPPAAAGQHFLSALDAWWQDIRTAAEPDWGLPFTGGWFVFLGYELARQIEASIEMPDPRSGPVAFATRVPVAVVRNRQTQQAWVVAEKGHSGAIDSVCADVAACRRRSEGAGSAGRLVTGVVEPDPQEFIAAADDVRRRIARGDVYQVNLAHHWHATLHPGTMATDVYARLRQTNPAPFAGIATLDDWTLISSSPERLVRSRAGVVETRPIAGTRPTADDPLQEEIQRQDLLANPKERAEHIMLIDLERNDLGRVSDAGSVEVDEFMVVESYAHVHHIVSNVRGRLGSNVSPGQLIAAMFPGGTITGCPKVRCMQIIGELESSPRGPYTGSMGYLNRDGSCDFNILIRSILAQGRELSFAAGSGIVADSEPLRELEETRAKAKGLLLALGV